MVAETHREKKGSLASLEMSNFSKFAKPGITMPCIANSKPPEAEEPEKEKVDPIKYRFSGYQLPMDMQKDNVQARLLYWSQPAYWSYRAMTYQNLDMR